MNAINRPTPTYIFIIVIVFSPLKLMHSMEEYMTIFSINPEGMAGF